MRCVGIRPAMEGRGLGYSCVRECLRPPNYVAAHKSPAARASARTLLYVDKSWLVGRGSKLLPQYGRAACRLASNPRVAPLRIIHASATTTSICSNNIRAPRVPSRAAD